MKLVAIAAAMLLSTAQVQATAIYDYVGNPFDEFRDSLLIPGAYSRSMRVTGFVEFASPLPADATLANLASLVLSFSFTDGRITWNRGLAAPPFADLFFGTNSLGEIDEWAVEVVGFQPLGSGGESLSAIIGTQSVLPLTPSGTFDAGQICRLAGVARCNAAVTDFGAFRNQPGVWTLRTATVAEPQTASLVAGMLAMMALGLTGPAGSMRRRARLERDRAA